MKYTLKTILVLSVLVFSWGFCAFGTEQIRKTFKVELSTALPPQARTSGTVGSNTSASRNQWLKAELKFKTHDEKIPVRRFSDNPRLEIQIAVGVGKKLAKNEKIVIFSGKIDYVTLEFDGKEHYLKALLPAVLFRRYAYNRQPDRANIAVKASYLLNGKVVAVAYNSNCGLQEKLVRDFFRAVPKNAVQAPDTVYGRQGTSWSIIEVNKYEMEKIR